MLLQVRSNLKNCAKRSVKIDYKSQDMQKYQKIMRAALYCFGLDYAHWPLWIQEAIEDCGMCLAKSIHILNSNCFL